MNQIVALDTINSTIEDLRSLISSKLDKSIRINGKLMTSNSQFILNKNDIGLSRVDNTSDVNKPVSNATRLLFDTKVDKTTRINGYALSGDIVLPDPLIGRLDQVDNTRDIAKPISIATQSALDLKVDKTLTINGNPLVQNIVLDRNDFGLSNVDNTSDMDKPVSTAQQAVLNSFVSVTDTLSSSFNTLSVSLQSFVPKTRTINGVPLVQDIVLTSNDISGFSNIDNTRDMDKPVSTAMQLALDLKNDRLVSGTNICTLNNQSLLTSSNLTIDKTFVGLSDVIEDDAPNDGQLYCRMSNTWQRSILPIYKDMSFVVNATKLNFTGSCNVTSVNNDESTIEILGTGTMPYIYLNGSSYGQLTGLNFTNGFTLNYGSYGIDIQSSSIDEAPNDGNYYSRQNGSWQISTSGGLDDAPNDGNYYARLNGSWYSFSPGGGGGGIDEAPYDGNYYSRQNGSWQISTSGGLDDAPNDGNYYARLNGSWYSFSPGGGGGGIDEAPNDGNYYSRQNGSWQISTSGGLDDAPNDGNYYARLNGSWYSFSPGGGGGGIDEAPYDGNYYSRQNGSWQISTSGGLDDAPNDGNYYARLNGSWYSFSPGGGGGGIDEAPYDGNYYARLNGSWYSFSPGGGGGGGIDEAPYDGNQYARQNNSWSIVNSNSGIDDAPSDGNYYSRQNGNWELTVSEALNDNNCYVRQNSTWSALTKSTIGLGNVDDTNDMDKPVSNAQQSALDNKMSTVVSVASENAMLSLSGILDGTIVVRTDLTYAPFQYIGGGDPSVLSNWRELGTNISSNMSYYTNTSIVNITCGSNAFGSGTLISNMGITFTRPIHLLNVTFHVTGPTPSQSVSLHIAANLNETGTATVGNPLTSYDEAYPSVNGIMPSTSVSNATISFSRMIRVSAYSTSFPYTTTIPFTINGAVQGSLYTWSNVTVRTTILQYK
jgi:hypothetical protein